MANLLSLAALSDDSVLVDREIIDADEHNLHRRLYRNRINTLVTTYQELQNHYAGESAPNEKRDGTLWYDSANTVLKRRVGQAWAEALQSATAYTKALSTVGTETFKLGGPLDVNVTPGSVLAIATVSGPALTRLTSTDVAFIDAGNDQLRCYRFNGSTWSLVGSGLTIANVGTPALTALTSPDVAFIDSENDELRCYRFNGSTWSLVGSGLTIATVSAPALATLTSTDVAFIDSTNDELRCYRFNGSTWSLVGSGLAIATVGTPALAALNSTDVAFIDNTNDELRCYRFNGSTWSLVGSGLAIATVGTPALAALNSTDVAFIDSTNDELRCYRFDGSTWSLVGSGLAIANVGTPALVRLSVLSGTDVAFIDSTNDELRCYRWSGSQFLRALQTYHLPADTLNENGAILEVLGFGTGAAQPVPARGAAAISALSASGTDWFVRTLIVRTGAATQKIGYFCRNNRDDNGDVNMVRALSETDDLGASLLVGNFAQESPITGEIMVTKLLY